MVSPILSSPVITGSFPLANKAITDFIDALVSLQVDPKAEFSNKMNVFVQGLDQYYYESFGMFDNRNFAKNLSYPSLVHLLTESYGESYHTIIGRELESEDWKNMTEADIQKKLKSFISKKHINQALPLENIKEELKEGYAKTDPANLIFTYSRSGKKTDSIEHQDRKDLSYEELFTGDPSEDGWRQAADTLDSDFNEIVKLGPDALEHENLIPVEQFESIAKNKNIIPAFKILNLRPLVRDLNGLLRLAGDGNEVIKQVATALDQELTAKAPEGQLDNYKKLALAVFPSEIAGRLRAAGFAPSSKA